jgi:Tfp pilus assembly protein PilV
MGNPFQKKKARNRGRASAASQTSVQFHDPNHDPAIVGVVVWSQLSSSFRFAHHSHPVTGQLPASEEDVSDLASTARPGRLEGYRSSCGTGYWFARRSVEQPCPLRVKIRLSSTWGLSRATKSSSRMWHTAGCCRRNLSVKDRRGGEAWKRMSILGEYP